MSAARTRGLGAGETAPGTRVQLTGYFLRATGQFTEGHRQWVIVACPCALCRSGDHVAVDEPKLDYGQYEDLPPDQRPRWRHFDRHNLQRVGKLPKAIDLADQVKSS